MIKARENSIRFWALLAVLILSGGIINAWERAGEARVSRKPLKEFPQQVGSWRQQGDDVRFDDETQSVLRADDYVSRNFESNGRIASLYVGYYATQRNGATYHSPLNCLPGAGWVMSDGGRITITPAAGPAFEANRYVIQNGNQRAMSADRQGVSQFFRERCGAGLNREAHGDFHQDPLTPAAVGREPGGFAGLGNPGIQGPAVFRLDGSKHETHALARLVVDDPCLGFERFCALHDAYIRVYS